MNRPAPRWPWNAVELSQTEIDEHEDQLRAARRKPRKPRKHKTCAPPPEPVPCARCGEDSRGLHILVGPERLCFACGTREMQS